MVEVEWEGVDEVTQQPHGRSWVPMENLTVDMVARAKVLARRQHGVGANGQQLRRGGSRGRGR